jgi:hypothetical protein
MKGTAWNPNNHKKTAIGETKDRMTEKYNPWVIKGVKLGTAQAGTFVGSKTGTDGITSKVIVDDASVNEALCPPADMDNAVLAGGVNIVVEADTNYAPTVHGDNRLRTCEITIRTLISPLTPGTYGKGAKLPDTGTPGTSAPGGAFPKAK